MNPLRFVSIALFTLLMTMAAMADNPADAFPSGLGYSFSEQTGPGFSYRFLDSKGGWQVSALATNQHGWYQGQSAYSVGLGKHFVLYSFVANDWFASQFYWLGSVAYNSHTETDYRSKPNPHAIDAWDDRIYYEVTVWKHKVNLGPVLGIEGTVFQHFSLNVEVGYNVGYEFTERNPINAFSAVPGFSAILYYRF